MLCMLCNYDYDDDSGLTSLLKMLYCSTRETRGTPCSTWTASRRTAGRLWPATRRSGLWMLFTTSHCHHRTLWIFSVLMIAAVTANVAQVSRSPGNPVMGIYGKNTSTRFTWEYSQTHRLTLNLIKLSFSGTTPHLSKNKYCQTFSTICVECKK